MSTVTTSNAEAATLPLDTMQPLDEGEIEEDERRSTNEMMENSEQQFDSDDFQEIHLFTQKVKLYLDWDWNHTLGGKMGYTRSSTLWRLTDGSYIRAHFTLVFAITHSVLAIYFDSLFTLILLLPTVVEFLYFFALDLRFVNMVRKQSHASILIQNPLTNNCDTQILRTPHVYLQWGALLIGIVLGVLLVEQWNKKVEMIVINSAASIVTLRDSMSPLLRRRTKYFPLLCTATICATYLSILLQLIPVVDNVIVLSIDEEKGYQVEYSTRQLLADATFITLLLTLKLAAADALSFDSRMLFVTQRVHVKDVSDVAGFNNSEPTVVKGEGRKANKLKMLGTSGVFAIGAGVVGEALS